MTTDTITDATAAAGAARPLFRDSLSWYLGISAYWFAVSFKWFILFLLLPVQVRALVPGGAENAAWGSVVTVGAVEAMFGPAVFGYLSDRCRSRFGRRRPFVAVGAALTALALLYLGQAHQLPLLALELFFQRNLGDSGASLAPVVLMALGQVLPYLVLLPLVLGYLFLQISDDVATGPYAALVPDLVPEEHRGRIGGVMSLLQLGAQIVAAVVGIALSASPFLIYVVIAAINIVCAAIVWFSARERGLEVPPSARPITAMENEPGLAAKMMRGVQEWTAPWRGHDFRWVWITRFLNALGWSIIVIYVSNYLNDVVKVFSLPGGILLKDSLHAAIVIALIISLSGAVSALYAGKMADKIGRKRVMLLSGWLMFAALVPFALYPNYTAIAVLALLFGIGYGAYISASWAIAADVLPSKEDSGKDMGIWQMSVVVPQFITGMIGALIDRGNEGQEGFGFTLAFLFAAAAFLAAGLLVRKVRGSS